MKTRLPVVEGDARKTLQDFLAKLLEAGIVDLLYVPMRTSSGTVTPTIVSNPALLSAADPLAPVMSVNGATQVGKLSIREPRPKVGVVLRPCEIRALVELTKMLQSSLKDLLLISVDCAGTFDVPIYQDRISMEGAAPDKLWQDLFSKPANEADIRQACQMCEQPVYEHADITIELLSSNLNKEIMLSVSDDLAAQLELNEVSPDGREDIIRELVETREAGRDEAFAEIRARMEGNEDITNVFAACIRCHNCMNVCPICYCKTCVFKSEIFEHEPMQYLTWVEGKGAFRMPADTMLFHLTRLNHMVLSCVGCGMCTQACPAELPVGTVFRAIGQRVQEVFEYLPGRDAEEPLPLITFKADEWTEIGEE
jgi:formate dehydrogenase subunit beta